MSDSPALRYGGNTDVPEQVAICPECGERLYVDCEEWVEEDGCPTVDGLAVYCSADEESRHRHFQSDWQSVIDSVAKWCGAEWI